MLNIDEIEDRRHLEIYGPGPEGLPHNGRFGTMDTWARWYAPRVQEFVAVSAPYVQEIEDGSWPRYQSLPFIVHVAMRSCVRRLDISLSASSTVIIEPRTTKDYARLAGRALIEDQWRSLTARWRLSREVVDPTKPLVKCVVLPESLNDFPGDHWIKFKEIDLIKHGLAMVLLPNDVDDADRSDDDRRLFEESEAFPSKMDMVAIGERRAILINILQDHYPNRIPERVLDAEYESRYGASGRPRDILDRMINDKKDPRWSRYIVTPKGQGETGGGYGVRWARIG